MWREWKKRAEVRSLTSYLSDLYVWERTVFDSLMYLVDSYSFMKQRSFVNTG